VHVTELGERIQQLRLAAARWTNEHEPERITLEQVRRDGAEYGKQSTRVG
jgi:hypothetical protein